MNFTDFVQYVKTRCMYETIYEDSDSNLILVIRMLDAYAMANKMSEKRTWVGLTDEEVESLQRLAIDPVDANGWGFLNRERYANLIEAKLKEKNT